MTPDALEPLPTALLSQHFDLPAEIHRGLYVELASGDASRTFEVVRVDDANRHLATLVVTRSAMHWLEIEHGGAIELAPGWLGFRPVHSVRGVYTRRLCQRRLRVPREGDRSADVAGDPPAELHDGDRLRGGAFDGRPGGFGPRFLRPG